jgi:hypothetical protein
LICSFQNTAAESRPGTARCVMRHFSYQLTCISHTLSSRDAARICPDEARAGFSDGLYEYILSKENLVRNEGGASRSKLEQKEHEKCGLRIISNPDFSERVRSREA